MGNWITTLGLPEVIEGLLCCTTSTVNALCSSCTTKYPRFLFSLFLLFGTIASFLVLSPNMRSTLDKIPYFCTAATTEQMCDNLVGYGAVYRICFSVAIFYGVFALLMLNTSTKKDIRVRFHDGYWFLKLVLLVAIFIGAFHIPRHTEFGLLLMYAGLTAGFIFIMIQILLVIDFAHSWSFSWAEKMESENSYFWGFALAFSTILVYSTAITMAVFYYLYFTDLQNLSKCRGNMFLISFNILHCLLASIISVLPRVQDSAPGSGLLQSSIISLYTMYLTWCTLSSEPDGSCNPMGDVILEYDKVSGVNGQAIFDCVLMFALLIFACNVRSSTSKLEKIGFSLSRYPIREDVERYVDEENIDLEYNYSFFHFVMCLASLQLMMVVTNWHSPDELADLKKLVKNWATVWIQLSSSFLCVLFYIWTTVTPLVVRTWGPCLGLDYESVPTEDDDDRRRREMIRDNKRKATWKMEKSSRDITAKRLSKNKDGNYGEICEPKLGNASLGQKYLESSEIEMNWDDTTTGGVLSKSHEMKRDLNSSEKTNVQNLGNLSFVKNQGEANEEITQDSGMCDASNLTNNSRSISRASARGNLSKSTVDGRLSPTAENRSESALSNQTVNSEIVRTDNNQLDVDINESHNAKQEMKYTTSTFSRPQSAQSRLNKNTFPGKEHKISTRPYSSMAFTGRTSKEESKDLTHNSSIFKKTLPTRPVSCLPSFLRRHKEINHSLSFEGNSNTEHFSSANARNMTETTRQGTENVVSRSHENLEESPKKVEDEIEGPSFVNEPITQSDKQNVLRPTESPILQNTNSEMRSRGKEEVTYDQDTLNDRDLEPNTEINNDIASEKATTAPLKMRDHLKWVKSLRRTRGKPVTKRELSENNELVESRTDAHEMLDEKTINNAPRTTGNQEPLGNYSVSHDAVQGSKMDTKNTSRDTLDQSVRTEERLKEKAGNELPQRTRGPDELQTPGVSREILRLQEKILKFQAKVVKTQQRIFQMQHEDNI